MQVTTWYINSLTNTWKTVYSTKETGKYYHYSQVLKPKGCDIRYILYH